MAGMIVLAQLSVDLEAFEVALHDEVDDAGDGIRSISRGGPSGDHFDTIHQSGRNLIEIGSRLRDRGVRRTDAEPATIDQHQGATGAEPAQVGGGDAARGGQTRSAIAQILAEIIGEDSAAAG